MHYLQNLVPEKSEGLSNPISNISPPDQKIKRYILVKKNTNPFRKNNSDKIIDLESGEGTSQLCPSEDGPTQDDDCILVENHVSVIVIDDENPGDNVSIKNDVNSGEPICENGAVQDSDNSESSDKKVNQDTKTENNSNVVQVSDIIPLNKLEITETVNSIFEVESQLSDTSSDDEVEIVKVDDEICTSSQAPDSGSIMNSPMSKESKSEQQGTSSLPMENKENQNFYEDHTSGLGESVVPLYNEPSTLKSKPSRKRKKRKRKAADDSVVFLSEEIDLDEFNPIKRTFASQAPQFIPLTTNEVKDGVPAKKVESNLSQLAPIISSTPLSREVSEILMSEPYRNNTYHPTNDLGVPNLHNPRKRMIIVDASNVAFAHSLSKQFSVKGLEICINYFEKMGHEVKAVLPLNRGNPGKSTDPKRLSALHRAGKIVFTPCKNLPGLTSTSYDDRFILQLAVEFDAAVISNDNYRDLLNESIAFRNIIEKRVIGYTWCNDVFILPKDPYGRLGPPLSVILNRN